MTGEEWVDRFLTHRSLVWDKLSLFSKNEVTRIIPCTIRCWRVGVPVEVKEGQPCSECGKIHRRIEPTKILPRALAEEGPQLRFFFPNPA